MRWQPREWTLPTLGALILTGTCFEATPAPAAAPGAPTVDALDSKPAKPIDINSASRSQLKTLPFIGDAEAQKIIAHRPYHSKADLVTKNVLPAGVFQSIRGQIIAIQPGPPAPGKHP